MPERWGPLHKDREGAASLLAACELAAREAGRSLEADGFGLQAKRLLEEDLDGGILRNPAGSIHGLAVWERIGAQGRRVVFTVLAPERQTPAGWKHFITSLLDSSDSTSPVLILDSFVAGLSESDAMGLLGPRGFYAYHRYRLVFPASAPLPAEPRHPPSEGRLRTVGPADLEGLAALNVASYAHTLDRFLFAAGNGPLEDARQLLRDLFDGKFGTFLSAASFGLEIDGILRGAVLVTDRTQYKLIADVEVHPDYQGRGYARQLIRATLAANPPDGKVPLVLVVGKENGVAYDLYLHAGFVVQEGPFTVWANCNALGIPPPPTIRIP